MEAPLPNSKTRQYGRKDRLKKLTAGKVIQGRECLVSSSSASKERHQGTKLHASSNQLGLGPDPRRLSMACSKYPRALLPACLILDLISLI